jgi:hypothetical protein
MERADLVGIEAVRGPERVEAGAPERLVDVDVPEAGESALVEERRLERRAAVREPRCERGGAEAARERLLPQACR